MIPDSINPWVDENMLVTIAKKIILFFYLFIYFTYIADLNFYKEFYELNSFEYQTGSQMLLQTIESRRTFQIVPQEHGRSIRV